METKLNYKRTFLIGLAFLSICSFWQMYDNIIPLILQNTYHLGETMTGAVMALDNVLAIFLLPVFGALSDKVHTKLGRRMPFIVAGTILAVIFMMLLPMIDNAEKARWNTGESFSNQVIFLAVLFFTLVSMGLSGTFPQDFSVQYPPHMLRISVQIRQLQYIHLRCLFCDLRQGNSCKSDPAVFDLFQYFAFRTQFCFTLHDDVDPSSGTLLHQFCKTSALPNAASGCH